MNEAIALIAVGAVVLVAAAPADASPRHSCGTTADQLVTEPG